MEKLLHERLREGLENLVGGTFLLDTDSGGCVIYGEPARQIADEIERYYIPRPRFEDGEPVQFEANGKEILWEDEKSCWVFNAIGVKGVPIALGTNKVCARAAMTDDGFVKRPTPKVHDADGVEIKEDATIESGACCS